MKKQLLIAAVAATMTSVAFADISLTGSMKVNYKNTDTNGVTTDTVTQEGDLVLKGTSGATTVHVEVSIDAGNEVKADKTSNAGDMSTEDVHMSTTIGAVGVKVGTWNPADTIFKGNADRTSGNWILNTDVSGMNVSVEGDSAKSATVVALKGSMAGVSGTYKSKSKSNELYLATDIAGVSATYAMIDADAANSSAAAFTLSKEFNGVTVSYSDVDADSLYKVEGDTAAFGDAIGFMATGDDASSIKIATSMAGNNVSARMVKVDGLLANGDIDVNTFVVTRPLAGGTTLEVTYTDTDKNGVTADKEVLDVELAVKF